MSIDKFDRIIIGHKHKSIMDYKMPVHVYKGSSDKLKERTGFFKVEHIH